MKNFLTILAVCLSTLTLSAFDSYYLSINVEKGDGIYSLLRKYNLDNEPCNFQKFYELNDLKSNDKLLIGKSYILPILIVQYNGQSIRTTMGINDWDTAVSIKEYNEYVLEKGLRQTQYVDSKILWVPHHLADCQSHADSHQNATVSNEPETSTSAISAKTINAPSTKTTSFALFGKEHETVQIKNTDLKNKVYYIVSGHGGPDPGARCTDCAHTMCEDEYAYDVALRLAKTLMEQSATVHVIIQDTDGIRDDKYLACDQDETCLGTSKIPLDQKARLNQRTSAINTLYAKHKKEGVKEQYALFIHVDSNHEDKRMDVYFFHHESSKTGAKLALNMQNTFKSKYQEYQSSRGYNGSIHCKNLHVIRTTTPPAILIELGNIKNSNDQKRLMLPGNRQALADWMAEGLSTFKK